MAKLSAHGYEVARIKYGDKLGTDTDYEVTLSFRSDGHIMRNLKALNIHSPGSYPFERPADAHHVYGWKVWKRLARLNDPSLAPTVERQRNFARNVERIAQQRNVLISSNII